MAAYAAFDQTAADRKRKAIQRLQAAAMAAHLLQRANQQRQGLPESPTPPKPELPQGRPMPGGRDQGRPNLSDPNSPYHTPPQHPPPPGRPQRPVGNLAGGTYQPPHARMPERHIPFGPDTGKPNLGGSMVKPPRLPQLPGRPQINPLDEQLATQRAELLGRTQRRPRSRRGANLLAQILGRFSQG